MAKGMKDGMMCPMCHSSPCKCMGGGWHNVVGGLVTAVGGLLMVWPQGWFTFEHTFGVLVFLAGLCMLWCGFKKH